MRALENADRIREAPARLPTASRADLTAEWLRLFDCAPPSKLRRELLMAAIPYRFVSEKTDRGRLYRISESRSRMISSSEDFGAALAGLERASRHRLTEHWSEYFGAAPPPRNPPWV